MLKDYVAVDLETTGLSPKLDKIIEIGAIKVRNGQAVQVYETFINPGRPIPERITQVTGISDDMVADAPYIEDVISGFAEFEEGLPLLGHNLMFDYSFLKVNAVNSRIEFERKGIDTLKIARIHLSSLPSRRLDSLCEHFGIADENHHRAVNDAAAALELYKILCELYENESEEFIPSALSYKSKRQSPITEKQMKYIMDLAAYHRLNIDYEVQKLSKSEASRIIDKIILEHGRIF